MDRQQAFQQLKPACLQLLQVVATHGQRPNARRELIEALTALLDTLRSVVAKPGALDAKLSEYAFVPISQVLRSSKTVPVRALELSLECISLLLEGSWGGSLAPELSGQLLILFTFMAKPTSAESATSGSSEELQVLALKCMGQLFNEASKTAKGKQQLTATANVPALGEATLVALDCLASTTSNSIRFQAVTATSALVSAIEDGDALASFLPRMVSSLTKVLTPSSNRIRFRVLERGLDIMSMLFFRLLSDQATKNLPQTGADKEQDKIIVRSVSWMQATASQIKLALGNILKLRDHDKLEVRQALLRLSLTIVQECRASLVDSVGMVIETMIILAGHKDSQNTVENDLKSILSTDSSFSSLLKESLHAWTVSLPRLMQSKDDTARHRMTQQISIALRLLDEDPTMGDDLLIENLRDGVAAIFKDPKGVGSITEATPDTTLVNQLALNSVSSTLFPPLKLHTMKQEDAIKDFGVFLGDLAKSSFGITIASDLANTLDLGSQEHRLASFWISVNLLTEAMAFAPGLDDFVDIGGANPQEELLNDLYSHSLSVLDPNDTLSPQHWHFQALALRVFALQATRYKSDFRAELNETLYPILHCLGSFNPELRGHAIACLNTVASSCGYESAGELVISNVDYIVNAVGLRLSYGDVAPQAPQVLLMMMRLCGPSLLPYLDDLVDSIFGALSRYHGYPKLVELLFAVLRGMADEGVKTPQLAITTSEEPVPSPNPTSDGLSQIREIRKQLQDLNAKTREQTQELEQLPAGSFPQKPWKELTEEDLHLSSSETQNQEQRAEEEEPSKEEEPPPPAPRTFDILLKISGLTQHYLTSSSPSLRTSLLSLLHTTIPALAKHENSFLPLIHTLWPVLLPRLEDPEAYVVSNALDVVDLMCTYAGSFMRSRIESAWDIFLRIHKRTGQGQARRDDTTGPGAKKPLKTTRLTELSNITAAKGLLSGSPPTNLSPQLASRPELYVDAPSRMLWTALVHVLCAISQHVHMRAEHFDMVLDILDPVLERADVRSALDHQNADAVWLRLYQKSKRVAEQKGVEWEAVAEELGGAVKGIAWVDPEWGFVEL